MALLATQTIQITGLAVSFVAAAGGGDSVVPGERTFLWVRNIDAGAKTVSVVTPASANKFGQNLPDVGVTVTPFTERLIGPLTAELADTDGLVDITYSPNATAVTVAAVQI